MNCYTITTEHSEHEYDHGTIFVSKVEGCEWSIQGDFHFVIGDDGADYVQMCREIQEVIRRYAI